MKNNKNHLPAIITITIIGGVTFLGGVNFLNIDHPHFFSKIYNPQKPLTEEEKRDNIDIEAKEKGDEAIKNGDYLSAIGYYNSISDNSNVVSNKNELIEYAKKEYLSYILSKVNTELENENFNDAKILISEALEVIPDNDTLLEKQIYVSAREELHSLTEKNDLKDVIIYINSNENIFGNDKTVSEIYAKAKENYLSDIISDSNQKINSHEYDRAREIISAATQLIGTNKKLSEQITTIDKKEATYNISVFRDKEDWYGMYKYINSLKESVKNDHLSTLKDVKNKMINIAISESNGHLKNRDYDSSKKTLSDLMNKIGNDNKIDEQFKKIEKTIVSDTISDFREKEAWRDIIDYLNQSSLKNEFKLDYSNAYSKYKTSILNEAKEYLQNDKENTTNAYDILLSAKDILSGDKEYEKLCEECKNQGQ